MVSQELNIRNRFPEDVACSDLEEMVRDDRYELLYQDQQFKIAVREYQRQERDAFNQAVTESSENFEVMVMQEFQGIQNRYEGRMEENERRVAQVIPSVACFVSSRNLASAFACARCFQTL